MSCLSPVLAYCVEVPRSFDDDDITDDLTVDGFGSFHSMELKKKLFDFKKGHENNFFSRRNYGEHAIELPCGKCLACRLDKAAEWSTRLLLESCSFKNNYFCTFTYDDEHLTSQSLVLSDFQKFIKRLRINLDRELGFKEQIRLFYAGEYGSLNLRPHFHAIFLNLPLPDLIFFKKSNSGGSLYISDFLSRTWSKGFVTVADLTYESAGYTARYTMKKALSKIPYDKLGIVPEFHHMSNRPGIGSIYFTENQKKVLTDGGVYVVRKNVATLRPIPKGFERYTTSIDNIQALNNCRELKKRIAENFERDRLLRTNIPLDDYRKIQLNFLEKNTRSLKRDL